MLLRARRLLAAYRSRDPPISIVVLIGMALGLGVLLLALALVVAAHLAQYFRVTG